MPLKLFVIKPVEAREQGHDHPVAGRDRGAARVPAGPGGPDEADAPVALAGHRAFVPALRRCRGGARTGRAGRSDRVRQALRDRRAPLAGPRKIYVKELIQAITLADRLLARAGRPPPARALRARDDDDHLARGLHHRPAVLVHRPRARHLRARAEPARAGCGASSTPRGSWSPARRRTSRHLKAIAPEADVHLVYHGLSADFTRPARARTARARRATGTCACSASAGSWPRRASTCSSTRARVLDGAACRSRR